MAGGKAQSVGGRCGHEIGPCPVAAADGRSGAASAGLLYGQFLGHLRVVALHGGPGRQHDHLHNGEDDGQQNQHRPSEDQPGDEGQDAQNGGYEHGLHPRAVAPGPSGAAPGGLSAARWSGRVEFVGSRRPPAAGWPWRRRFGRSRGRTCRPGRIRCRPAQPLRRPRPCARCR